MFNQVGTRKTSNNIITLRRFWMLRELKQIDWRKIWTVEETSRYNDAPASSANHSQLGKEILTKVLHKVAPSKETQQELLALRNLKSLHTDTDASWSSYYKR